MKKVAIQGIPGCYHEMAARSYFTNEEVEVEPCLTFPNLFEKMSKDDSLLGIMAIENTIAGSLLQNHELLRKSDLSICGEYKMSISHLLAGLPGETLQNISEINSHPIALMQCEEFLNQLPNIKIDEELDVYNKVMDAESKPLVQKINIEFSDIYELY